MRVFVWHLELQKFKISAISSILLLLELRVKLLWLSVFRFCRLAVMMIFGLSWVCVAN